MPRTNATIFIDSKDRPSTYASGSSWAEFTITRNQIFGLTYGHSVLIPGQSKEQIDSGDKSNTTSGDFVFEGSALSFYGHVDPPVILNYTGLHAIDVSINGAENSTYQILDDGDPHSTEIVHRYWFTTPTLEDGTHTLNLSSVPLRLTIDWFTVTPSDTSSVRGKTLIIDDDDETIRYTGAWTKEEEEQAYYRSMITLPVTNRDVYRRAYGGGTHVSRNVGDFVQIPFTGTSIKVLGFFPWREDGNITLAIGTDYPNLETLSFPRVEEMPKGQVNVWDVDFEPDFLFYESSSDLPEGDHVLTINVTDISGNQSFILDSIIYTASFESLAIVPEIALPTIPFPPPVPSAPPNQLRNPNVGAIVGGVVGGVALLTIIALLFIHHRRGNRIREEEVAQPYITDEFLAKAIPNSGIVETAPLIRMREKDRLRAVEIAQNSVAGASSSRGTPITQTTNSSSGRLDEDHRVEELENQIRELEQRNIQSPDILPTYSVANSLVDLHER